MNLNDARNMAESSETNMRLSLSPFFATTRLLRSIRCMDHQDLVTLDMHRPLWL